jgi:hypothetical protein
MYFIHEIMKMDSSFLGMRKFDGIKKEIHNKTLSHTHWTVEIDAFGSRIGGAIEDFTGLKWILSDATITRTIFRLVLRGNVFTGDVGE